MAISMDEAFDNCLASLYQGSSIEDCAARFPQYEQELTGLLGIVDALNKLNQISPALGIKMGVVYMVIPLSGTLFFIYAAGFILEALLAQSSEEESHPIRELN